MDIFSQAGCRNTLIMKSKKVLPGSHFSGFVSAIPGRIPSVVKAARATRADTVNLPHEESFQGKILSPSGTTLSHVDAFCKWGKAKRFPLPFAFCPLHLENLCYEQRKEIYASTGAIVPATLSEYWPDLFCKLFLKPSKKRDFFHAYNRNKVQNGNICHG